MPAYFCHTCMDQVPVTRAGGEVRCNECGNSFVEELEAGAEDPESFYAGAADDDDDAEMPRGLFDLMRMMGQPPGAVRRSARLNRRASGTRSSASGRSDADTSRGGDEDEDEDESEDGNDAFLRFMQDMTGGPRARRAPGAPGTPGMPRRPAPDAARGLPPGVTPMDMFMRQLLGGMLGADARRGGPAPGDYVMGNRDLEDVLSRLFNAGASSAPPPTRKAFLDAIPRTRVTARDLRHGDKDCTVCQDSFAEGELAMELPCKHRFHAQCLEPWLKTNNTCPVCRHALPAEDGSGGAGAAASGGAGNRREDGRGLFATGISNALRAFGDRGRSRRSGSRRAAASATGPGARAGGGSSSSSNSSSSNSSNARRRRGDTDDQ